MNRTINNLINHLSEKPRTLFLIDGLGAFLTAFFLFVIIRQLNQHFGMPITILTYLSVTASFFGIYSITCFLFLKARWVLFIRIIGIANLLYCFITIGMLIKYDHLLTTIGTTYFLMEAVIIAGLSYVELKVATDIKMRLSSESQTLNE